MGQSRLLTPRQAIGPLVGVREKDKRRAYLEAHVFELLIGVLTVVSALTFFASPGDLARTPIGHAVHPFDTAWNALYLGGGILVAVGILRPSYRLELAGLLFLSSAIAGAGAAIALEVGTRGASSISIYAATAAACIVRITVILRLERAVLEVDGELKLRQPQRRKGE